MKKIRIVVVFIGFLMFSIYRLGSVVPTELVIEGTISDESAKVNVQVDSGNGFNSYENQEFDIEKFPRNAEDRFIKIRYDGDKNSLAPGKEVVCATIIIDGKKVDFNNAEKQHAVIKKVSELHISKGGYVFVPLLDNQHVHIELFSNYLTGNAVVEINGKAVLQDLYTQDYATKTKALDFWFVNDKEQFALSMDLPRYEFKKLRVTTNSAITLPSVFIKSEKGEKQLLSNPQSIDKVISFNEPTKDQKRYFYLSQLIVQIAFSILSCWGIMSFFSYIKKFSGVYDFFLYKQRYLYWLLWFGAVVVFSLWLIAFWPGIMSTDSLKIWRGARLPEVYFNDHPFINALFYRYLIQFWDNTVVVPIAHILLISTLIASVFFYLFRQGIALFLLIPLYLFCILSVPVGVYNTVLWKDVPFAMLIVLWGCILVLLYRQQRLGRLRISLQQWLVLFLLYMALGLTRHNGVIYFIVIPICFVTLGLVPFSKKKILVTAVSLSSLIFVWLLIITGSHFTQSYFFERTSAYLNRAISNNIAEELVVAIKKYPEVLNITNKKSVSDHWHHSWNGRYRYDFLRRIGWNDIFEFAIRPVSMWQDLSDVAYRIYKKTYIAPWVYLTWYPVWALVLYPLTIILFRWTPNAAIFSTIILVQLFSLLFFIDSLNWRYYYFACLGGYFIVPILLLDIVKFFPFLSSHHEENCEI